MFNKNKLKIIEVFFEEPNKNFQLRQISRLTGIAVTSTKKYLQELLEERLLLKDSETLYPSYKANQENKLFKIYKQQYIIFKINCSGLIDYLEEKTLPRCIVLFGSMSKGEYNKKSDMDLFIQSLQQELDLKRFEKKLKHKINVLFETNLKNLNKGLLNNILNGIILSGHIRI
ncbi:hypothetical protein AYK26_06430 [Euryarchaeota archaeon SM23-78]|nr:MAG: hypothetical protein AYK26_06430 [Euryarchaeota archaeon SM23-78]